MSHDELHDKLLKEFTAASLRELMGLVDSNDLVAKYVKGVVEREDERIRAAIEYVELHKTGEVGEADDALREYLDKARPPKPKKKGLFR